MLKMKKRQMGKQGASSVVTIMAAFGMATAAFVIFLMTQFWMDVRDDTFLEKSYLARDLSLMITTAQAAPGDLTYCYYMQPYYATQCHEKVQEAQGSAALTKTKEIVNCENIIENNGRFDFQIGASSSGDAFVSDSKVVVVDKGMPFAESQTFSRYLDSKDKPVPELTVKGNDARNLAVFMINKNAGRVYVDFRRLGQDASPCTP